MDNVENQMDSLESMTRELDSGLGQWMVLQAKLAQEKDIPGLAFGGCLCVALWGRILRCIAVMPEEEGDELMDSLVDDRQSLLAELRVEVQKMKQELKAGD